MRYLAEDPHILEVVDNHAIGVVLMLVGQDARPVFESLAADPFADGTGDAAALEGSLLARGATAWGIVYTSDAKQYYGENRRDGWGLETDPRPLGVFLKEDGEHNPRLPTGVRLMSEDVLDQAGSTLSEPDLRELLRSRFEEASLDWDPNWGDNA